MSGLSINNLNSGNSPYTAGFANSKENNAEYNGSLVSKMDRVEVFTPPEPFNVFEPFEFENPFENPFDWDSISLPFEIEPPEDFDNPFSIEMPVELDVPTVTDGLKQEAAPKVMEPYTYGDGGASKSAVNGKKVTPEELGKKYKCSTCESRKYQDVSSDPGVSFQMPTKVSKANAHSAVAAHEQQHVARNQDKAEREGREVVSQTVTYHSAVCPECGDTYRSGGTTKTVTRSKQDNPQMSQENQKKARNESFSFEI